MEKLGRPGPKPKRLYLRRARFVNLEKSQAPGARAVHGLLDELERVGRLVAHGSLTSPPGDLLVLRARDLPECDRILRRDPYRDLAGVEYELLEWDPKEFGTGVNLDPPPALGSGRLTFLQRIAVVVRDQGKATEWYRDVLGLSVRDQDDETGYVEMSLGRGVAALSLVAPRPEWGEPYYSEAVARVGARTGIAFQTDSVEALALRLHHVGARVTQEPRPQPWGGVTLRFTDPDGNEFLAFEPERPRPRRPVPTEEPARKTARPGARRS